MTRLSNKIVNLLEKSKESALLAVDIYNKPKTTFRSGGFVVLMCVAWTSLLHAIFEKQGKKYFYRQRNKRKYLIVDGERKTWELLECAKNYFEENDPRLKNIEFFVKLRNKIEHRFMPSIDSAISGECQAFLLNFEELITQEFSKKHSLIDNLFIPLQFTRDIKSIPKSNDEKKIIEFIKKFRSSLSSKVSDSQKFSFKAYFVPKLGNHRNSSDVAIEFIKYDPENPEEMQKYEKMIVGIKEKIVPVANQGKYRPSKIIEILKKNGYPKNLNWHTEMWKKYEVRPKSANKNRKDCRIKYCQYDEAHGDYIYTDEWVDLLIEKELKK